MARVEGRASAGGFAAAVVAFSMLCAVRVTAQSEPVVLVWSAPPACSSAEDVLARVRKLTKSAQLPARQLHAEAHVATRELGRLHLNLRLRTGELTGERHIDGRSCEDLAGATAVVLALLLSSAEPLDGSALAGLESSHGDSAAREAKADSSSSVSGDQTQSPDVAQESTASVVPKSAASAAPRAPRRWFGVMQIPLVSLGIGPFPKPSAGFALAAGARFERWSLVAEGAYWLEQNLKARELPDSSAEVGRVEAAVRACRGFAFGSFELAPCLRASLQHVWARGSGLHVAPRTARASWFAGAVGMQARYHIAQWFSVFGGVDLQLQGARPRISIDDVGSLGRLWPAACIISLGAEWIL